MTTKNHSVSEIAALKDYIFAIDFSNIIEKMVSHQKWRRNEAEKTCELYRNFLYLNVKYPEYAPLPPSEDIDEFWHNHILDTKKYIQDCQVIFGGYFHHYPYFGIDGVSTMKDLQQSFQKTQELHHQEFGEYIYAVRRNFLVSKVLALVSASNKKQRSVSSKNMNTGV